MVKHKGKQQKKGSGKTYEFRTLAANNAVKHQFNVLLSAINESVNSLKDAVDGTNNALIAKDAVDEWSEFINCDKVPKTHMPQAIRDYFFKKLYCNREDVENSFLWVLNIDEHSILSQDLTSIDMTRRKLELSKINFGYQYDDLIREGLDVLKRIEETLVTRKKVETQSIYDDINCLKAIGEKCIKSYIDEMTYRVLSCENAYMNPLSYLTEEYEYIGKDFECHIWAVQSVPIRFTYDLYPFIKVDYRTTNSNVILPLEVLHQAMVVRSLHLNYDHYSEYAKSFSIAAIVDATEGYKQILKKEWNKRLVIQLDVRNHMLAEREQYEEYLVQKEIEEAQRLKALRSSKEAKKVKVTKKDKNTKRWTSEPPQLTPDMWPVTDKDFLTLDDNEYLSTLEKINPSHLCLASDDINLRNYRILGGVYEYNFVVKPKNTILPKRVLTWREKERVLKYLDKKCTILEETIDPDSQHIQVFIVSIILPANITHFGNPIPCQWFGQILLEPAAGGLIIDPNWINTLCILDDINLNEILSKPQVFKIIQHAIPRTISSYNFDIEVAAPVQTDDKMKGLKKLMPKVSELSLGLEVLIHMKDNIMDKKVNVNEGDAIKNPERLYPIYEKTQPVVFNNMENYKFEPLLSDFIEELDNYKTTIQPKFIERKSKINQIIKPVKQSLSTKDIGVDKNRRHPKPANKTRRKTRTNYADDAPRTSEIMENEIYPKWSTSNILHHTYDPQTREVKIWTDRLGTFGFAYNSYGHFPFKNWMLQGDAEDPGKINFLIESKYAKFQINVTPNGYTTFMSDFSKTAKSRKVYLEITKPVYHLRDFIKQCRANNLNIFPERDASFYVNGRFCEKHFEAECHAYFCMTKYSKLMKFSRSQWNRLAHRRILLFKCEEIENPAEEPSIIKITPEEALFVDVTELCTDLTVIELQYTPTWRNIEFTPDLLSLITSSYPGSKPKQIREPKLITNLLNLLTAIRPLSFS